MAYSPQRKKKNWWEEAVDDVSGFFGRAVKTVARGADRVIPGDQSSWHREESPRQVVQRRPSEPIQIQPSRPTVVASFKDNPAQSVASFEENQVKGINFDGRQDGLQVQTARPVPRVRVEAPQVNVQRISVAPAARTPNIQLPQQDPTFKTIDQALDRGESWEKISNDTKVNLDKVREYSQRTRPNYGIKPQEKQNFSAYKMGEGKNKTIFGADVSGLIPGERFDKTYEMKVEGHAEVSKDDFLKQFDRMSDEAKKIYVNGVKAQAQGGSYAAQNTLQTLEREGRFKGDLMDFIEGSNDRLYGGIARTTARTIEMLPGDQGAGAWADKDAEKNKQFTTAGKYGEYFGSAQKGIVDAASMVAGGGAAEKALRGTRFVSSLDKGTRVQKLLGYGITNVGGGAVSTGIEAYQTYGRGDEQNIAKSAGIGAAMDLATPAVLKGLGRGFRSLTNRAGAEAIDYSRSVITDLIEETDPQIIKEALGVSDQVASQLAGETSEQAVAETLRKLSVDPKLNISPEIRERMEREGITDVQVGESQYGAHYDRNGRITVTGQDAATDENLFHEIGHAVWQKRLTPDERQAFAGVNGRASQEARGRAGYSADDIASEDFSDFTRLALTGRINEVPESVRKIVIKYAGLVDETADIPGVVKVQSGELYRGGNLSRTNYDDRGAGYFFATDQNTANYWGNGSSAPVKTGDLRLIDLDTPEGQAIYNSVRNKYNANPIGDETTQIAESVTKELREMGFDGWRGQKAGDPGTEVNIFDNAKFKDMTASQPTNQPVNNLNLGNDARARFANRDLVNSTPAAEISAKYGGKVEDVQRNIDRYGEEVTRNMYASKSDSPTIVNIDAVATAELRKKYGKARVTGAPGGQMTPEELASLEASAPNVAKSINDPVDPDLIEVQNAVKQAQADGQLDQARQLNDSLPPEARVELGPPKTNPDAEIPDETPLGRMAEAFYESKKGNQAVTFNDLEKLGRKVTREIDVAFKRAGSDFPTVARTVETSRRNGINDVMDMDLTPIEKDLWLRAQDEMNFVRDRALAAGRDIGEGDFGNTYFPNQDVNAYGTRESLLEGFNATKPGNEIKRTNAIDLDSLNYSPEVVGGYITRYADSKIVQEQRIYTALERNNPDLPEETIREVVKDVVALQDKVNSITTKIKLFGAGKRVSVSKDGVVDFAEEMTKIGQKVGKEQIEIATTPRGLTNGDRINSVDITYKGEVHSVADFLGLNQLRDSAAYAGSQVERANGDLGALVDSVAERLGREYQIPAEEAEYLIESIARTKPDVPEQIVAARVESVYRAAAKSQLLENLQKVNITNKTLRNDISQLANQIVREGTTEQKLSAQVVSKTLRATNALFRKLNVSSALNELSDTTSMISLFGRDTKIFQPDFALVKELGLGEIDPSITPYLKSLEEGKSVNSVVKVLHKANDATRLYKFVETYKAGVMAKTAKEFYSSPKGGSLTGDELTAKILESYRTVALPVDMFTKTFLDNYPLWTQYMTWGARNLQKEARLATGQIDLGVMADKSTAARIARNAYANLPAKTVFWLASNGLKGTAIMTAFGLTDFTGLTSQDYSGIQEEDKNIRNKASQWTNMSTVGSLINTTLDHYQKEQLKNSDKYKNADYNPYEHNDFAGQVTNQYTPQFLKNAMGANELMDKGYSENKAGRVQYEAPTDAWNTFKAFAFGKNQTANAREYSGRKNIVDRLQQGDNPVTAVKDMALEQIGQKDTDYNRPLTDDYSDRYKAIDKQARTALLAGGRQYNNFLDDLKKNEPDAYNNYITSMDGNHVQPEFWREVTADRKTFEMMRDRKKQLQKDLGTAYDPIYDLPDDQANQVLKYKSSPTGEDLALRNILNKEQWYKDYKDRVSEYYDKNPAGGEGFKESERVKAWNALDDKLGSFYYDKEAKEAPAWSNDFPLVYQQKAINAKYGFGSAESDAFFKANADAYYAQKEGYDKAQLDVINQMREIEGVAPMSWAAYQQATEFADTDESDDEKGYGRGRGGNRGKTTSSVAGGSFGERKSTGRKKVSVQVPKVSVKRKGGTPGKIKVKKGGKLR